jgi:hypothetical protein
MNLSERLQELETLRQSGQVSETEFAKLVLEATQMLSPPKLEENTLTDTTITDKKTSTSQASPKKLLVAALLLVIAVVGFIISRPGEPTESKEYKALLSEQKDLIKTQQEKLAKMKTFTSLKDEVALYEERIVTNQTKLKDVQELSNS